MMVIHQFGLVKFEQRAGGPMRIAAGSLLRVLENFRVADGSIILYQTGSALIALGHVPRRAQIRISAKLFFVPDGLWKI